MADEETMKLIAARLGALVGISYVLLVILGAILGSLIVR